jgi:hypothetical protein
MRSNFESSKSGAWAPSTFSALNLQFRFIGRTDLPAFTRSSAPERAGLPANAAVATIVLVFLMNSRLSNVPSYSRCDLNMN